ncbi:MAG: DUF1643 domain-containing protein [Pseudomonadota bacterium]
MSDLFMRRSAVISECNNYRTWLERRWAEGPPLILDMLNPSKADAKIDDPTIRRGIGFAQREGLGGLVVVNFFALRATNPKDLIGHPDPIGPENVRAIGEALLLSAVHKSPFVVACGAHSMVTPELIRLVERAAQYDVQLWCLGKTKHGFPRHPLYLAKDTPLEPFVFSKPGGDGGA